MSKKLGVAASAACLAVIASMGQATDAFAQPPSGGTAPSNARTPSVMRTTNQPGGVSPYTVQNGNTCEYFPPDFYDPGVPTGNSDTSGGADVVNGAPYASAGSYFDLFGTGGTQDSYTVGGSNSGSVDQQVGEWVSPQGFPANSTVTIYNPWGYDGVLKTGGDVSPIPFVGGSAGGSAGMDLDVVFSNNGNQSNYRVATRSASTSVTPGEIQVFGSGNKNITTAIVPNVSNVGIFDGIDMNLWGNDNGAALTNTYAFAVFEGNYNGINGNQQLGGFDGSIEKWAYTLPTGWAISSC